MFKKLTAGVLLFALAAGLVNPAPIKEELKRRIEKNRKSTKKTGKRTENNFAPHFELNQM